jgi:hypothetical protein
LARAGAIPGEIVMSFFSRRLREKFAGTPIAEHFAAAE